MNDLTSDGKAIFFLALEQPTQEELVAYLDKAYGQNTEVRVRVENLLRAHQRAGNFLGGPSPVGENLRSEEVGFSSPESFCGRDRNDVDAHRGNRCQHAFCDWPANGKDAGGRESTRGDRAARTCR